MKLTNLSAEADWTVRSWLPHGLSAEEVVFLPDACPGKAPLPAGTAVLTRQADWRRFAVSDCGCGMRLLRASVPADGLSAADWEEVAGRLRKNKSGGGLGDLGGGNHFLDALAPEDGGPLLLLVHTGSRSESGLVDGLVEEPEAFDREFARVVAWAERNRAAVQAAAEAVLGRMEVVLDLPHNTVEPLDGGGGGAVIRKGSVRVEPGELSVLPPHADGGVVLVRATERVGDVLNAVSHGTGRAMSRRDCKPLAEAYDFAALRERVLIPESVSDGSLRTDGPYAYRSLEECLRLLDGFVEVEERFRVVGYMGHL